MPITQARQIELLDKMTELTQGPATEAAQAEYAGYFAEAFGFPVGLAKRILKAGAAAKTDGEADAIYEKYFGGRLKQPPVGASVAPLANDVLYGVKPGVLDQYNPDRDSFVGSTPANTSAPANDNVKEINGHSVHEASVEDLENSGYDDPEAFIRAVHDKIGLVVGEVIEAAQKFPRFNSTHEGFAVLKEEVDELWAEIKLKHQDGDNIHKEAIQAAAMAVRLLTDCLSENI